MFSARYYPPPKATGNAIPDGVRNALLTFIDGLGSSPTTLWSRLLMREGLAGDYNELLDDFRYRFGADVTDKFDEALRKVPRGVQSQMLLQQGINPGASPALRNVPTPLFLDVLEDAYELIGYATNWQLVEEANRLFEKRGINYRMSDYGKVEWHGDQSAYETVVEPALKALADPRLGGAYNEFEAALAHLRKGTYKDREDAIEEAGKSVESVMKVLLDEKGVTCTGKETASPLFNLLKGNKIVVPESEPAVLAAARIRNANGGHGAGSSPRAVAYEIAELAVRSAATAITFLAAQLP